MSCYRINLQKIYPIINIDDQTNSTQFAKLLLSSGIKLIQIRYKDKSPKADFINQTKEIINLKKRFYNDAVVLINDYVDICKELGADGVHLGQNDTPINKAREMLGNESIIGLSTHNLDQASKAPVDKLNYLACGPVFNSKTKSGHANTIGINGVKEISKIIKIPIVAIGGIDFTNINKVIDAGASSVAMISALRESKNLKNEIQDLLT